MRTDVARVIGINAPPDGYTPEESELERLISHESVAGLYAKLPTSRMKAIVALHFELGYDQELLGQMFGMTQEAIAYEISIIRQILRGKSHRPQKPKPITITQLMQVLVVLSRH